MTTTTDTLLAERFSGEETEDRTPSFNERRDSLLFKLNRALERHRTTEERMLRRAQRALKREMGMA